MAYKDVNVDIECEKLISYNDIADIPSINDVPVKGKLTSEDLGLQPAGNYLTEEVLEEKDYATKTDVDNVSDDLAQVTQTVGQQGESLNDLNNSVIQLHNSKQNILTAGEGVSIENDVISVNIESVDNEKLVAGKNIEITTVEDSNIDNAVSMFHFNNSVFDSVSNVDLSQQGTTTITEHKFGDGSFIPNNSVTLLDSPWGFTSTSNFTVDFWVKSLVENTLSIGFTGNTFDQQSLVLQLDKGGSNGIRLLTEAPESITISNSDIDNNEWNHIALTHNGESGKASVFVNGNEVYSSVVSTTYGFGYFCIFNSQNPETSPVYVDELRISNVVQYDHDFTVPKYPYVLRINTVSTTNEVVTLPVFNERLLQKQDKLSESQLAAVNSGITSSKVITYDGLSDRLDTKQDKLTAGSNISITKSGDETVISSNAQVPDTVWEKTTLSQGVGTQFISNDGIDNHTLACFHFDGDLVDAANGYTLFDIDDDITTEDYFKFGTGSLVINKTTTRSDTYITELYNNTYNPKTTSQTLDFWFKGNIYRARMGNIIAVRDVGQTQLSVQYRNLESINITVPVDFSDKLTLDLEVFNHLMLVINSTLKEWYVFLNGIKIWSASTDILQNNRTASVGFNITKPTADNVLLVDELRISSIALEDQDFNPASAAYTKTTSNSLYEVRTVVGPENTATKLDIKTVESELSSDIDSISTAVIGKREKVKVVTDLVSTDVSVVVESNTTYNYGTLSTLNIVGVPSSNTELESVVLFTANSTGCVFTYPGSLRTIGTVNVEAGKSYVMSIMNNILVIGELNS